MGPVLSDCGVLLGMTINAQPPFSFEGDGRAIPGGASQHACGRLAVFWPEGSALLAFGRALVLRLLVRQQLQKDSASLRIGRFSKQPSIEPDVLIVDELFHFSGSAFRSPGRHFQLFARGRPFSDIGRQRQPMWEWTWHLFIIAHIQGGQVNFDHAAGVEPGPARSSREAEWDPHQLWRDGPVVALDCR